MTLRSQGIVVDGGQPQANEDEDVQGSGSADGIVEEAAPETILPMDDEYES